MTKPLPSITAAQIRAGWAAARMAAEKFDQIERTLMQNTEKRPAEQVFESEAGSQLHMAIIAVEARSACEIAYENFQYDDDFPADVLAAYKLIAGTEISV